MSDHFVGYECIGRVASVRLDRPEAGNRIVSVMMSQLVEALSAAAASGAGVLTITGAGADFCVGRDQEEIPSTMTREQNTRLIVEANRALGAFPGISVATVQGRALGFGCGFALQADLTLAAETATFGFDEIRYDRPPRFVMAYLADYVGIKRALDLVVSGRLIGAAQAEGFGMVSRVVAERELRSSTDSLVSDLLGLGHDTLAVCKRYPREVRRIDAGDRDEYAYAQTVGQGAGQGAGTPGRPR